jgi:HEAT repeat protein
VEDARLRALVEDLSSPDENIRLKAANAFVNAEGDAARVAVPRLREMFHADPNPAVKFLAKKALTNLGEELEPQKKASEVVSAGSTPEDFQVLEDGRALWKVAQDLLSGQVRAALDLVRTPDSGLQEQLGYAIARLGPSVVAGPLIEAYVQSESFTVSSGDSTAPSAGEQLRPEDIENVLHAARLKRSKVDPSMAAAMGNWQQPEVAEVLKDMLLDEGPIFAHGAFLILATRDDEDVLPVLVNALGACVETLDEPLLDRLEELAKMSPGYRARLEQAICVQLSGKVSRRAQELSVRFLGRLGDTALLDTLREALDHDIPEVRAAAVRGLSRFDLPGSWLLSNIRPLLKDDVPFPAATACIALMGRDGEEHGRERVEELLAGDVPDRLAVARALAKNLPVQAVDVLEKLLRDGENEVREAAIVAAKRLDDPAAAGFLGGLLTDPDEAVSVAAIEAVGRMLLEEFNDLLLLLIDQTESARVRATILGALGRLGFAENVPTVAFFLNADDARVRANAIEALERINDPKSMSLVHLSLNDPAPRVRANAVRALWGWGEIEVAAKLGEALHGSKEFQASACHALGDILDQCRHESALVDRPLLVKALRQSPKYAEFQRIVQG